MRAAIAYVNQGLGTAILVGREETDGRDARPGRHRSRPARASRSSMRGCRDRNGDYADYLYARLQRKGYLFRDCQRLVNTDRNHLRAPAWWRSAMPTPWSPASPATIRPCSTTCAGSSTPSRGHRVIGVSIALCRGRTVLVADTAVARHAHGRGARRHRRGGGRLRPPHGLRAARRDARLFDLRPPARRARAKGARGGQDPRQAPRRFRV